jgi:hypothetical protein
MRSMMGRLDSTAGLNALDIGRIALPKLLLFNSSVELAGFLRLGKSDARRFEPRTFRTFKAFSTEHRSSLAGFRGIATNLQGARPDERNIS